MSNSNHYPDSISRSQRPISPQQLFDRLMISNYRQIQCEDQTLKLKQQKQVLLQLIIEYQRSIESELTKLRQQQQIAKIRQQRFYELQRLKRQRDIIQEQLSNQINRLKIKKQQNEQKQKLTLQLKQLRQVNMKIRMKLRDLNDYVTKLEIHNKKLESDRNVIQTNVINRMRVNEESWKENIGVLRKKQEVYQNQLKAKILEKESENLENIRRQENEIKQRNKLRWNSFKINAFSTNPLPPLTRSVSQYSTRLLPERNFQRFRVI